ncbi:MAG: hypothetical protein ACFFAY_15570, partial [Promethearchaeota archaeon]
MDWGSDNTLFGTKTDWQTDHWYFFAIVWNETSNYLAFFWGDETTLPTEDTSTNTWTPSVVGLHSRNCIMNSERKSAFVDGHVDEFRYFTIERSLTEIGADYRKRVSSGVPGLSNYYTFENDLSDSAGGANLEPVGGYAFSHDVFSISDGWNAEQLEVNVMGLRRLHALNGSFASGNPGVNDDWSGDGVYAPSGWLARRETSSFFGRQRASYISDEPKYVSVENEGYILGSDDFRHYNDTRIFWYQDVDNTDQNEQFVFSMNYLYQNGPIGTNYLDIFSLKAEIRDSSTVLWNWSVDLVNTTQRQIWFSTGSLSVNLTDAPSTFELRIELEVLTAGDYVDIDDLDPDLDGDSTNGLRITALIDDVSLTAATVPSCESVDLSVRTRETGSVGINGTSGSGSASINYEFWNSSSIPISFSANTSVSFTYSAKVSRMTRLLSSLSTTDLQSIGVAYSVDSDMSVNLTLYTYVASYPEAEDLGLVVYHPHSWENATIEDPFGGDPGPIETEADYFEVPAGAIDSVGWWTIRMQAPNYAKSITTQKYLESGGSWTNESVYLTGDRIRCQITVGTTFDNPTHVTSLELDFLLPSEALWTSVLLSNASGSTVTSMGNTFGSYNSSNGEWTVVAFWENGSAVAYGHTHFEIHHQLTMFAHTPSIQRNLGENFTAAVYIHNQETGEPILGSAATVVSNWTGLPVFFSPNLAKGWWEADFNTSDIGVGSWTIAINATIPFFMDANCTIGIQVMTLTLMTTLGNYYVEISPGSAHIAKFRYMFLDGTGIEDANVFVATWSGPSGGLQYEATNAVPGEPGNYTIQFTSSIGGTYFITITGTKEDHSTAATSFYLIVGALPTELDVAGEELPDDLFYNQTYQFVLYYSSGSFGIEGASVNVTHHPAAVVNWTETGSGYYSFSIRVTSLGSYAIYLRFQEYGYSYADTSLYFNVVEIPTSVSGSSDVGPYYESRTYDFAIFYNSTIENGITGAALTSSASIRVFYHFTGSANGWYYFTLTPL